MELYNEKFRGYDKFKIPFYRNIHQLLQQKFGVLFEYHLREENNLLFIQFKKYIFTALQSLSETEAKKHLNHPILLDSDI